MDLLYWLVLFLFPSTSLVSSLSITINEVSGSDRTKCLNGAHPCATLDYAAKNLQVHENISILLSSQKFKLKTVLTFDSWTGLKIFGKKHPIGNATQIVCNNQRGIGTGLYFSKSTDISLQGFILKGCSMTARFTVTNSIQFRSALVIQECKNVYMARLQITESDGFGAIFMNNKGKINITHSEFTKNALTQSYKYTMLGGAGALILSTKCSLGNTKCKIELKGISFTTYNVRYVNFTDNDYTQLTQASKNHCKWYLCSGGGLSIYMGWATIGHVIRLYNIQFFNNTASEGGGLSVTVFGKSYFNEVKVSNSTFQRNQAKTPDGGGGGVKVSILTSRYDELDISLNEVRFYGCLFVRNQAVYGGGSSLVIASVYSSLSLPDIRPFKSPTHLRFENCSWFRNRAKIGAAVDVSQQATHYTGNIFITVPTFENCYYIANGGFFSKNKLVMHGGTFQTTNANVEFKRSVIFAHNHATALYLQSAYAIFKIDPNTLFYNNKGQMGGAIALYDNSFIWYKNGASFNFTHNRARIKGGAIYATVSDPHDTQSCFFKAFNGNAESVSFHFHNNYHEDNHPNSIYLTAIYPCAHACNKETPFSPFKNGSTNCLGDFYFDGNEASQVMTDIAKISLNQSSILHIIPGQETKMPVKLLDDLSNDVTQFSVYYISFQNNFLNHVRPQLQTNIISTNYITIYGTPGQEGSLQISTLGLRQYMNTLNFKIVSCPPGYVNDSQYSCHCSVSMGTDYWYNGVLGCNDSSLSIFVQPGYWIGYVNSDNKEAVGEDQLYTGHCPPGYCSSHQIISDRKFYQIQTNASIKELNKVMCHSARDGILCSQCMPGTSVFYHTYSYKCYDETKLCHYGIIFYFLSELVPMTILFAFTIYYNISFTSGTAYSVVFFIQQINILFNYHQDLLNVNHKHLRPARFVNWFYFILNLQFFIGDNYSFCIWKGASAMDTKVISYASLTYAIGLILLLVITMKHCCVSQKRRSPLVHGLTAFLVLCYSRVTQVTFNILQYQTLRGKGGIDYPKTLAFWDGSMVYFRGRHLYYAIPALVFLVLVILPTPLCLIFDPLLLKLEGCLRVKPRYQVWTKIRENFKPLLDSFQSCFKDKYRSFAGFYFLYRVAIMLSLVASSRHYFIIQVILILMLVIQSILQPFELKRHNIIASVSFCGLLLINIITIRIKNIISINGFIIINQDAQRLQLFHLLILYSPLLAGIGWVIKIIFKRFCQKNFCRKKVIVNYHHCSQRSYSEISLIYDRNPETWNNYGAIDRH